MTTLSDTEIREILVAIFPERPAPPVCELSENFTRLLRIVVRHTTNFIPPVVMENKRDGYRTGCVVQQGNRSRGGDKSIDELRVADYDVTLDSAERFTNPGDLCNPSP